MHQKQLARVGLMEVKMFEVPALKRCAASIWTSDAALRAALGNDDAKWLRSVVKLEHCPRMGASEHEMVRGLRDSIVGGGNENGATQIAKPTTEQLIRLLAASSLPAPVASASAEPSASSRFSAAPYSAPFETVEQTRARAAAAFNANTQAGAQLRSDFAGSLSTYQAYEVAARHRRVRISSGGGFKTYRGGRNANV